MTCVEKIASALTMHDVAVRYGFSPDRKGFISCPFHNEKTASLKLYPEGKGWYCFGCGEGGDVIDFVKKLYGLNFSQAVARLDYDFSLGLCVSVTARDRAKMREDKILRSTAQDEAQRAYEEAEDAYLLLLSKWEILRKLKSLYAPKSQDEIPCERFVMILKHFDEIEYRLDVAQSRKEELWKMKKMR